MNLNEFVLRNDGKALDFDKRYNAQCMDLYRFYAQDVLSFPQSPPVIGAADVWQMYLSEYYKRIPNTPTGIPLPGDIMVWNRAYGPYGHIAIVLFADVHKFAAFSQNDPLGTLCHMRTYTYNRVFGWLHPKNLG